MAQRRLHAVVEVPVMNKALAALALAATLAACSPARIEGTVTIINESGAKVCVQPDAGEQRCGIAYQRRDEQVLVVGQRVELEVVDLNGEEVFILVSIIDP
jgi:hypothetical protein